MCRFDNLRERVFRLLHTQLPSHFTYHSIDHTRYVIEQALFLAGTENVSHEDLELITTGALLHDIGFIKNPNNHEETGCEIARTLLTEMNCSTDFIAKACGLIMATKIPQSPQNKLERIVADADLEYLGTALFYQGSQLLYKELKFLDPGMDEDIFRKIQIDFLSAHQYHTDYCKAHREPQKQAYLRELMRES